MKGRLALLGLLLSACGTGSDTSTSSVQKDALRFSTSNLPVAYVGESFSADLLVSGGVSPYQLRLTDGSLPDGLSLNGTTLSGQPKSAGAYSFTVEASDASLSSKAQRYSLTVSNQVSFELRPVLPLSGVVGESRVPLVLNHPKGATAARFQWQLPAGTRVTAVQPGDGQPVLFWKQSGSLLTLDLGFRRVPPSGSQVAMLSLKPQKPVRIDAGSAPVAFQGRDGSGKLVGSQAFPPPPTPFTGTSTGGLSISGTSGTSTGGLSTAGGSVTGASTAGTSATPTAGDSLNGTSSLGTSSSSTDGTSAVGTSSASTQGTGTSDLSTGAASATQTPATSTGGASLPAVSPPALPAPGTPTSGGSR